MQNSRFYGWTIAIIAFFTFGLAVGIPYYGGPFFYDYYEKAFGWKRSTIASGFPWGVTLTLWAGPMLVHKFSPRKMLMVGAGFTCLAFIAFANMTGEVWMYYGAWFLYLIGYIFSGPIVHQVIVANWFKKNRAKPWRSSIWASVSSEASPRSTSPRPSRKPSDIRLRFSCSAASVC